MRIETTSSLLTVVGRAKRMFHRTAHLQTRLVYTAALFNILIGLNRQLRPEDPLRINIVGFSL